MSDLLEYKCPGCGGAVSFDAEKQKLKCPYCGSEFEPDSVKFMDEELKNESKDDMQWIDSAGTEWNEEETQGIHSYICESCGGEIIGDENTVATSCPYCDNPVVMKEQVSGMLKPDYVIPFKLDKKSAKAGLMAHLKGKKLLPKVFKDENHIDEIKGIYVPFWLFEADADAYIRYKGSKTRVWTDSKYQYTEHSHYAIVRSGQIGFQNVPVDGSSKMEDKLMQSIEPFDFSEAVDFQTAYLAGYFADKYDVDAEESVKTANDRIKKSTEEAFGNTISGYSNISVEASSIKLKEGHANYALYPVWILNTTWQDEKYVFAMNGQTGKFVGDLPIDKKAAGRMFWSYFAAFGTGLYLLRWIIYFLAGLGA